MFQDEEEGLGIYDQSQDKPLQVPKKDEKPADDSGHEAPVYAVKTQVGQERTVADFLAVKVKKSKVPIHSVLAPQELRGYVFVECDDDQKLERLLKTISYARTMLPDPVPFSQIEHFLTPVSAVAKIAEGDIIELVSGPFRGEKAKVTRIDEGKEEITVELFEAMVPIPITVKGENVRVLKRHDDA